MRMKDKDEEQHKNVRQSIQTERNSVQTFHAKARRRTPYSAEKDVSIERTRRRKWQVTDLDNPP